MAQPDRGNSRASGTVPRTETTRPAIPEDNLPVEDLDADSQHPVEPTQPGRRVRWTREMNIDLIRAYFLATDNERNKTLYRDELYRLWHEKYPDTSFTAQRLSD